MQKELTFPAIDFSRLPRYSDNKNSLIWQVLTSSQDATGYRLRVYRPNLLALYLNVDHGHMLSRLIWNGIEYVKGEAYEKLGEAVGVEIRYNPHLTMYDIERLWEGPTWNIYHQDKYCYYVAASCHYPEKAYLQKMPMPYTASDLVLIPSGKKVRDRLTNQLVPVPSHWETLDGKFRTWDDGGGFSRWHFPYKGEKGEKGEDKWCPMGYVPHINHVPYTFACEEARENAVMTLNQHLVFGRPLEAFAEISERYGFRA